MKSIKEFFNKHKALESFSYLLIMYNSRELLLMLANSSLVRAILNSSKGICANLLRTIPITSSLRHIILKHIVDSIMLSISLKGSFTIVNIAKAAFEGRSKNIIYKVFFDPRNTFKRYSEQKDKPKNLLEYMYLISSTWIKHSLNLLKKLPKQTWQLSKLTDNILLFALLMFSADYILNLGLFLVNPALNVNIYTATFSLLANVIMFPFRWIADCVLLVESLGNLVADELYRLEPNTVGNKSTLSLNMYELVFLFVLNLMHMFRIMITCEREMLPPKQQNPSNKELDIASNFIEDEMQLTQFLFPYKTLSFWYNEALNNFTPIFPFVCTGTEQNLLTKQLRAQL